MKKNKRAYNITEAALYVGVSRGIMEDWLHKGKLPYEELPGTGKGRKRFRLVRKDDIDSFLDKHLKKDNSKKQEQKKGEVFLLPRNA